MRTLFLIDANSLIHRAFHALPDFRSPQGRPSGALYGVANIVTKILKEKKPDYIAAAFDRPEPTFREKEFAEYKGTRPQTVEELVFQIIESRNLFRMMNIKTFEAPGWEADDILMSLSRKFLEEPDLRIIIFSSDLDTMQAVHRDKVLAELPGKGVQEGAVYNEAEVFKRFGVYPTEFADYKALVGDKSDNIPGVPGIGPKTAAMIIRKYGELEDLYDDIDSIGLADKKLEAKLKEHRETAFLSKRLVVLRSDVPVEASLADLARKPLTAETVNYCRTMGFKSLADRLERDAG